MKKHTRLLSLLLAISLLFTSVFVTTVFAIDGDEEQTTDGTGNSAVGSYTAPFGSWQPESGNVAYAVWETESDFQEGKTPVKISLSNVLTEAEVGGRDSDKKSFYVHLFTDCTTPTGDQLYTGRYHNVVINLGGKTLTIPMGIRVGNGSGVKTEAKLTVMNGTVNHKGGQMQSRQQSELRFENVVYNMTGGIFYDEATRLIEFKNSTFNLQISGIPFDLSVVDGSNYTNELRFVNTDIIQTTEAVSVFVRLSTPMGSDANLPYTVFFDKDSTLTRSGSAPLIGLNSSNPDRTTAFPVFTVNQQLKIEVGFTMSEGVIIDEYAYSYVNKSSGATLYTAKTVPTAAGYSKLDFSVIKDGAPVEYTINKADGFITFAKAPTVEDAWTPEGDTSGVDYTGMTYAMWASEMDYLLGNAPVKFSTVAQLDTALIGSTNRTGTAYSDSSFVPGYVRLYTDVTVKAQINVGATQKLTIDFGGHKITNTKVLCIPGGANTSLTLKNGSFDMSGSAKFTTSGTDSTIIFEDLEITSSVQIFNSCTSDYVRFTGCTITSQNGNIFELGGSKADVGSQRSEFILEDTDVIFVKSPTESVFVITENTTSDALWDISLDKDSSIKGATSFITLSEFYKSSTHAAFTTAQNVKIENGFLYNDNIAAPTEYLFIAVDSATGTASSAVSVTIGAGTLVTLEVLDSFDKDPLPEYPEVDPNPDPLPEGGTTPDQPDVPTIPAGEKGSYTTPEGAWTPTADYSGITYGVWFTESDFLSGRAPVKWSTDPNFNTALIGTTDDGGTTYADPNFIPGYVHCFTNVTNVKTSQFYVGHSQKLVINLAGHTLDDTYAFRIGGDSGSHPNASLTIKNGVWNYKSGLIQSRSDSTFIVENVIMNVDKSQIFYTAQGDVITFSNSKIVANTNVYFLLGYNSASKGTARSTLKFANTEIILKTTCDRLFEIAASRYGTTAWDIYFDANSSIEGEYKDLIVIKDNYLAESGVLTKAVRQNLFVELGCKTEALFTAKAAYHGLDNSGNALEVVMLSSSNDKSSIFCITSVDPNAQPDTPDTPDTPDEPDTPPSYPTDKGQYTAPEGAWIPTEEYAGITYGLWASEADYLAGKPPVKWSDSAELDGALIGSDTDGTVYADPSFIPGYLHAFTDLTNTAAQVVTGGEQKLVFNLAGHKLDDKTAFRVGGSSSSHPKASFIIKNGTWNYISGQIQLRYDVEFIVENVIFNVSNSQIFYWTSADYVIFRDCQIIAHKDVHFGLSASYPQHNAPRSTLRFENTEMIFEQTVTRLFEIKSSNYGTTAWDIYFDKDTTVKGNIKHVAWLQEAFVSGGLYNLTKQNIYFELGFGCTNTDIVSGNVIFKTFDNKGIEVPGTVISSSEEEGSIFYLALVEPGTTTPAKGDLFALSDGEIITLVSSIEGINLAYMFTAPGAAFKTGKIAVPDENGICKITCTELQAIPAGSNVYFFTDLTYDPKGSTAGQGRIHGIAKDIVFDLGGNKFSFNVRFQLEKSFTFKNGTISLENVTTTPLYGSALDETFTFINVDIVFSVKAGASGCYLFELHDGNIVYTGGKISAPDSVVFRLIEGTENRITLDGVTVNCGTFVEKTYWNGTDLVFTVNNSDITATSLVYRVLGTYSEDKGDRVDFIIRNSSVRGTVMNADGITAPLVTLTVYDTFFSEAPSVPAAAGTLVIPRGQKLMAVEGGELPLAIKTLGVTLKANLTLESVFGVQFFIPKDSAMQTITIGGKTYNVSELDKTVVYDGVEYLLVAVEGILPSMAAEVIDVVIVYTEDELKYTLVSGYSPLDYIKQVVSSDLSYYVKQMLVAATEYIALSYTYQGKESAELDALRESSAYIKYLEDSAEVKDDETDMSQLRDVVLSSAALDLGATMKLRFYISPEFSGKLTVHGYEYEVISGKVGELDYVELELAAYEMYDLVIEITADGKVGTYSLAKYVFNVVNGDDAKYTDLARQLVKAFYTYTMYANIYYGVVNN